MTTVEQFDITAELPRGTTLIEASAGTGKTWTVAALVTRYVAEAGIPIAEMLVVTFSRAASQELRERVRGMLETTLRRLESAPRADDDALVTHLRHGTEADVELHRTRLRAALADFDTATVATIHQFCQYVLRGLGVAGDSDSFATLAENLDDLRRDVIDDTYLTAVGRVSDLSHAEARADALAGLEHATAQLSPDPAPPQLRGRLDFVQAVREEYRRRKRRGAVLEYDDLLLELAGALRRRDGAARVRMRERWSVVLVDEFQDTDPVQWEVFARAFGEGGQVLALIGDPKQAIYSFRGGDVQTYLEAARTAQRRVSLPTNHRSDAPLVDALGLLLRNVQLSDGIVVHPITAARAGSRLIGPTELAAIDLRVAVTDEPMSVGAARAIAARDSAAEIAELLRSGTQFDGRDLAPHNIAVLAKRTADLASVRAELRRLNIPSVLVSSESVLRTEAASWWLQLLMAMEQPHRPERVRAAALTPFLGWGAEELDARGDAATDEAASRVRHLVAAYTRGGVAAVLDTCRETGLITRVLAQVGGERDLTDIEHCAQLLGEHVLGTTSGLAQLVTWLRENSAEGARINPDARIMRLESDALAVTLSTIHGSKGLQYPVVLTPFLWHNWVKEDDVPVVIHENGRRLLSYDRAEIARSDHHHEILDEDLRLAYVAMTRAQSRLIMWWLPTQRTTLSAGLHRVLFGQARTAADLAQVVAQRQQLPDGPPLVLRAPEGYPPRESIEETLHVWQDSGAVRVHEIPARRDVEPVHLPTPTGPLLEQAFDPRTVVDATWRRTSYSALAAAGEAAGVVVTGTEPETGEPGRDDESAIVMPWAEPDPELDKPSPMANLPMGATFGSLVHGVLEEADLQAADLHTELLAQIDSLLVRWPVDLDRHELADALVAVCETPLGPAADDVTLRGIAPVDRLPEMEFELPLAGGDTPHAHATLRAMAAVLRTHLPAGDPLLPYADELETPSLGNQTLRGYLTGSIDLTFRHGGRFHVVDYKTNRLGDPDAELTLGDYAPERLTEAMNHSSYPLQALLYAVVLHRYLRWRLPGYDPRRHLGSVMYLYVRGLAGPETPRVADVPCGVFIWTPPAPLVEALSAVLDGRPIARGVGQ